MKSIVTAVLLALAPWKVIVAYAIPLQCYIVGASVGQTSAYSRSADEVTNIVNEVNAILSQAAVQISLTSVVYTNCDELSTVDIDEIEAVKRLCSLNGNTGGLEVYFVSQLIGAVGLTTPSGIIIGSEGNAKCVAHEIGHACGFEDIYVNSTETNLTVNFVASEESVSPSNWGRYSPGVEQQWIIQQLLMYGYNDKNGVDIPFGNVHGLRYDVVVNGNMTNRVWQIGPARVGAYRQINRTPRHD